MGKIRILNDGHSFRILIFCAKPYSMTRIGCSFTWENTIVIPFAWQTFARFFSAFMAVVSRAGTLHIWMTRHLVKSFTTICSIASVESSTRIQYVSIQSKIQRRRFIMKKFMKEFKAFALRENFVLSDERNQQITFL